LIILLGAVCQSVIGFLLEQFSRVGAVAPLHVQIAMLPFAIVILLGLIAATRIKLV